MKTGLNLGTTTVSRKNMSHKFLRQLKRDNPNFTQEQTLKEVRAQFRANSVFNNDFEEIFDDIILLWFFNAYRTVFAEKPDRKASAQRQADIENTIRASLDRVIRNKAAIMLMNMVMPNGRMLKECTGAEVRRLADNPWLMTIADAIRPRQHVGNVLTEEQLQLAFAGKPIV